MIFGKFATWPHGCWPDAAQLALLQACLLRDPAARRAAFESWRNLVPFDFIDGAMLRMLPLLLEALRDQEVAVPDLPRIAGSARYCWVQYQLAQRGTAEVLGLFRQAGIETMVLKGTALNASVFAGGQRPTKDVDLVVRRRDIDAAIDLLEHHGWRPRCFRPRQQAEVTHACSFGRAGGVEIDLHWDFFHERYATAEQLDEIWDASRPAVVAGQATRILCPADQLLHTCSHGVRHADFPPFRWLADAHRIVAVQGSEIDWERCQRMAQAHGNLLRVQQTLRYLARHLDLPVPSAAQTLLRRRASLGERVALFAHARRWPGVHPFWQRLPRNLLAYHQFRRTGRRVGVGEYFALLNNIDRPLAANLRHFAQLSVAAARTRWQAARQSAVDRRRGKPRSILPVAAISPLAFESCYECELHAGQVFRWTQPVATVRLALPPGAYRVELQLLPARDLFATPPTLLLNRSRLAIEVVGNHCLRFSLTPDMFVDYREQRFVLHMPALVGAADDPRQLGLALKCIVVEPCAPASAAAQPLVQPAQAA